MVENKVANDERLIGVLAIGKYINRSESTVMRYIQHEGFPAGKVGEVWEANKADADAWRDGQMEESNKKVMQKKLESDDETDGDESNEGENKNPPSSPKKTAASRTRKPSGTKRKSTKRTPSKPVKTRQNPSKPVTTK